MTPVDGDCTKFNRCTNGYLTVESCPDGLGFDGAMKVCNYLDQVAACSSQTPVDQVGTGKLFFYKLKKN